MVKHGQKRPEDWESWLQCHQCGNKYPRFEPMAHGKLNLPTESHIEDNPQEAGKGIIIGAYANRKSEE